MRGRLKIFTLLALSAAALAFPVGAQTSATTPAAQAPSSEPAPAHGNGIGEKWNGECPERQDIREERERIRSDAEELDAEHDRLKSQCMDSKGQERAECRAAWEDLASRRAALHERRRALKGKAEADPGCHHEHKDGQQGNAWPQRAASQTTPQTAPGK